MHLQKIKSFAGVVALFAGKGFLPGVRKHVILHTIGLIGRLEAALVTFKGFELVPVENNTLRARIVTLLTSERLFSRMNEHVFLETLSLCAGVATLCAIERFLS